MSRPLSDIEREMQAVQRVDQRATLQLAIQPGLLDGIKKLAKERSLTVTAYAGQLLSAAYAARRGPVGDAALEAAVAGLDSQSSADQQVTTLRLRLDQMRGEQQNMDARQATVLAERDRTINELRDRLSEAEGRSAVAPADMLAELASEREQLRAELDAARRQIDDLRRQATTAAAATAKALGERQSENARLNDRYKQLAAKVAQREELGGPTVPAPAALTGAQLRLAQGWMASGWTLREITDALAMPDSVVRSALMGGDA